MKTMTRKEIASEYHLYPLTVANWHRDNKIVPVGKVGNAFVYDADAVKKFVEENKQKKRIQNSEVYSCDGKFEHGLALSVKGWRSYSKRNSLDDVPTSEILYEYFRPVPERGDSNH